MVGIQLLHQERNPSQQLPAGVGVLVNLVLQLADPVLAVQPQMAR
jgi:hypothetical protein